MDKVINIFGDSITAGACDGEMGGWADRLKIYFENDEAAEFHEVYNLGIGGDTTDGLLKRFANENEARNPDVILIAIGINDSKYINLKDNPLVPLERFGSNLAEIIRQAKRFTEKIAFIGLTKVDESRTMPTLPETDKYFDNENITLYNSKLREICAENNLLFVEMLDLLEVGDLVDGVHPDSQGHEMMFQQIKDALLANEII